MAKTINSVPRFSPTMATTGRARPKRAWYGAIFPLSVSDGVCAGSGMLAISAQQASSRWNSRYMAASMVAEGDRHYRSAPPRAPDKRPAIPARRASSLVLVEAHAEALRARHPVALDVGRGQHADGAADQQLARHEADVARVAAVVAIIAQHQVVVGRHRDRAVIARHVQLRQQLDAVRARAA